MLPPPCLVRGGSSRLAVPVDDSAAAEVVRRQLDVDLVARQDLDPVPAHLPGRVPQCFLPVLEKDFVHPATECLDYLALHLDLLFLGYETLLSESSCAAAPL